LFEQREIQRRLAEVYARGEELVPGDRVVHVAGQDALDQVAARVLQAATSVL
jgi:dTMP kinase